MNTLAIALTIVGSYLDGFSPINMLIDRVDGSIAYDISPMESITLSILSDDNKY